MKTLSLEDWKQQGNYLQIFDHKVFVIDTGDHPDTLVILHGYPSASYDYHACLAYWTQHYRVIIHDHLGLGLSEKPLNYSYSLVDQADIAIAVWQKLGVKSAHLLAHDYGTSVATELIARANRGYEPIHLKSITLGNGSMLIEMSQLLITQKLLKHDTWGPMLAKLSNQAIFNNSFTKLWADRSKINKKEFEVLFQMLIYNSGRKVLPKVTKYIEERKKFWHRWIGALKQTQKHIHLIWADKDPVAIIEMAYRLEKIIPSNSLEVLNNVGHYPMIETPERYAKAVITGIPV